MRLIDADALKAYFRRPYSNEETYTNTDMEQIINNLPTIEERPHGEWIERGHYTYCSECEKECSTLYNFCPNCGASMRKEGDEEC